MSPTRLRGLLCSLGGCLAWGFSGTCAQFLLASYSMPPLTLSTVRLLAAGPLLLAFCSLRGNPANLRGMFSTPGGIFQMLFFGLVGMVLSQFTYLVCISYTNAGTATMLGCLSSVMLLAAVCVRGKRAPRPIEGVGVALAVAATYLIATGGNPQALSISPAGLAWGIAGAATIAIYTLQTKPLMAEWGSIQTVAVGMLVGGVMCAGLALPQWNFPALDATGWAALAVMVLVGTCVSYSLFFQGILDLAPVEVGMLSVMEPVSATFFSVVWLGTSFTAADYFGFALMVTMVILIALAGDDAEAAKGR